MSTHHVLPEDLRAWVSGTADGLVSASVEQHVVHCPACQAAVAHELGSPTAPPRMPSGRACGGRRSLRPLAPGPRRRLDGRPRRDRAAAPVGPRAAPRPPRPAAGGRDARGLGAGAARLVDLRRGARRRLRRGRCDGGAHGQRHPVPHRRADRAGARRRDGLRSGGGAGARAGERGALPARAARAAADRCGAPRRAARRARRPARPSRAAAWVWLLPALGFTAAVLALSTWFGPWRPATAITALWVVGTAAANRLDTIWAVFAPRYVVLYLLMLVLGPLVLVLRARRLGTIGRISS